jgi:crossover junction endodeoxyribonuclease RuvC
MERVDFDYVLAIDPGLSGAIALYHASTGELELTDIPTRTKKNGRREYALDVLRDAIGDAAAFADVAVVEQVSAMPRQGVGSAFAFGYGCGLIDGVLAGYPLPVRHVVPAVWKAGAGIARVGAEARRADRKNAARARACEVFPNVAEWFARAKDDGRAEAALLAWWFSLNHSDVEAKAA